MTVHQSDHDWHRIADAGAVTDPGSRAFRIERRGMSFFGFVVKKNGVLYAYENFCPHAGRQLNWGPDRFLTRDQSMIMCAAHGALFEISSGRCVGGPCVGESLSALGVRERDGEILVYLPARTGGTTLSDQGN